MIFDVDAWMRAYWTEGRFGYMYVIGGLVVFLD